MKIVYKIFLGLGIGVLMAIELACFKLADHITIGISGSLLILILLNLILMFSLFSKEDRNFSLSIIGLIAIIIIPYQFYLGYHWIFLQEEASNILGFIYKTKIETGSYPSDLEGYTFTHPNLKKEIIYELIQQDYELIQQDKEEFDLYYYVEAYSKTSYNFKSGRGQWGYY